MGLKTHMDFVGSGTKEFALASLLAPLEEVWIHMDLKTHGDLVVSRAREAWPGFPSGSSPRVIGSVWLLRLIWISW